MIYTVTGPVDRASMGMMMAHEHFNWEFDEDFASSMYFNKQYDEQHNEKIAKKVPPHKFVWAHADHESNLEMILTVAQSGFWVGFDAIREGTYADRLNLLQHAFVHGYSHQVLLSQDYDMGEESGKENGIKRYCALFNEFVPYCLQHGLSMTQLESLLKENPLRFYDF